PRLGPRADGVEPDEESCRPTYRGRGERRRDAGRGGALRRVRHHHGHGSRRVARGCRRRRRRTGRSPIGLGAHRHVHRRAGTGAAAKLVANSTLFAVIAALGEAIALGEKLGISRDKVFEVLAATPLAAQAERRRSALEQDSYPPRFKLSLARKDAELLVEAAKGAGVDLRLAEAARSWLADAERAGLGDLDYSACSGSSRRLWL